ncbi:hypothetical protein [Bacillus pacificus]
MCKNSVRAQIDAAKEGRLWEYNKEEFRKEIKNVYEDSMKVANKMIEGNKILFSIKEVVIEREKIWSESGDEKYTLKGSIKAQIEAIKQGPAEWFKYNKEEFSREIKTVYEDSMKVADKIIDKYKPLADARDVLEARDKKWREAGEANTIISSFKAQLEVANKSPKAWWDYNIKGIQRETRHLFEDGRMYLIKYMDTPGLFDEVDDKASEKKDDTKKVREIEREGVEGEGSSQLKEILAKVEGADYNELVVELDGQIGQETDSGQEKEVLEEVSDTFAEIDNNVSYFLDGIVEGDSINFAKLNKLKNAIQNNTFSVSELSDIGKKISDLGITKEYNEALIKMDFGKYFKGLVGSPPEDMINPHAHHILFKRGLGQKQQELVREGQEILRRYGLDPIIGKENLVWAPNAVIGQHSLDALENVVNRLRAVEDEDGDLDDIVEALEELGELASRR